MQVAAMLQIVQGIASSVLRKLASYHRCHCLTAAVQLVAPLL